MTEPLMDEDLIRKDVADFLAMDAKMQLKDPGLSRYYWSPTPERERRVTIRGVTYTYLNTAWLDPHEDLEVAHD